MRRATYQDLVSHCLQNVPQTSSERETFLTWFNHWIDNTVPFRAPELTGQCLAEVSRALESAFGKTEDLDSVQRKFNAYVKRWSEQKRGGGK